MEAPISASQGAVRSLPKKLESLLFAPKHELRAEEKKQLLVLQADLQGLIDTYLVEPSEVVSPALTAHSWMKDVRDLSYDIDDFIYEVAHVVGGGARISVVQKPPRFKISRFPEKLRRRRWVTDEISRFRTRLKEAIRLHQECLSNCQWRPSSSGQPPPSPCDRLVGVDSSIHQLCGWLANDGQPEHRVVSIVGTGGVGKTTLAREVYRKLGGQFQCLAFVRTSPKADMKGLLCSLLSQVRRRRHLADDALDVHQLVVNINAHLQHKTYLIVIEDLWALSTWDLVNRALPKGNWCSRILTTTEADIIAQTCCADNFKFIPTKKEDKSKYMPSEKEDKPKYMPSSEKSNPMDMSSKKENNSRYIIKKEPLSEDESTELFSNITFGKQAEFPQGLKEVANEIIRRSGGFPLVINILASLLAHHPANSIEQWNYIKNSLSSDLTTHGSLEKINQVLNIGYDNLPHNLKACILYFCLYEEDCIIWKDDLVKQWIAEGFISSVKGDEEEEVAHSYFGELVNRGMIQPVDINCSDEIMSCRVHHIVLHFIRDKSMEENFCIAVDHSLTTLRLADKVRRLSFHFGNVEDATPPGPESMRLSKVRSVAFSGFHNCMPSILEFRFLQVLNIKLSVDPGRMMSHNLTGSDELSGNLESDGLNYNFTGISELFRLRYFHLDACHMSVALPNQIKQLKDLVAWEINAKVTVFPSDIVDLPGLLYLRIPREAHLPTGIGRMTSLRTLRVFDLSKNSTEDVMRLGELTSLQDLRLTCSTLQPYNLEKNLECLGSVIRKLSNLKCVTLVPAVSSHVNTQHDAGASSMSTSWNGFSIVPLLPALLQRLELSRRCCHFSSLPEWTKELTKLCILKIAVRKVSQEDVVILEGLPSLTALSLFSWTAPAIRIVFDNKGFSVLKHFKFVCAAPCLEFLEGAMPNVRKVKLGFNANRMERYSLDAAGFKRLTGLNEISIKIGGTGADEGDRKSAQSLLTDAIVKHPSTLIIINIQWVDWNFCGDDEKHIEQRKGIQHRTSEKQNLTAVESSDEHGIQEQNLAVDGKKQADTRTYWAPKSTFHLQNTDLKLSSVQNRTDAVAEKHKVDSDGYGEIDKMCHCICNQTTMLNALKNKLISYPLHVTDNVGRVHTATVTTIGDPAGDMSTYEPVKPRIKIINTADLGIVKCIDVHSTEPWILLTSQRGNVTMLNHQNQTRVMAFDDSRFVAAKFIEPLRCFVAGDHKGFIHVYSYIKMDKLLSFRAHAGLVTSLAVHPSEPFVLSASDDHLVKLWNWEAGWQCIRTFKGHSGYVRQVRFNPQTKGNTFASCSTDSTIKIWDIHSPTPIATLDCGSEFLWCLDYFTPSGDKQYLVTGSASGNAQIWDLQTNTCIKKIEGLQEWGPNIAVVGSVLGRPILLTVSEDDTVAFCDTATHRYENRVNFNLGWVRDFAYISMTKSLAIGCDKGIAIMEID